MRNKQCRIQQICQYGPTWVIKRLTYVENEILSLLTVQQNALMYIKPFFNIEKYSSLEKTLRVTAYESRDRRGRTILDDNNNTISLR